MSYLREGIIALGLIAVCALILIAPSFILYYVSGRAWLGLVGVFIGFVFMVSFIGWAVDTLEGGR